MFGKRSTEEEKIKENISEEEADLLCEEAILADKTRFGWVRTSLMRYLRAEYGEHIANRALWRVNRRKSEGYYKA